MGSVLYLDGRLRRHARVELVRKEKGVGSAEQNPRSPQRSLLRLGYNCWAIARAERAALIVDAKDYFEAFYHAALRAQRSILVLAWDFNSQTRLHFDPVPKDGPPVLLGEFLTYLVRRRRGLHVNVLNWDYPMVFGTDREFPPIYGLGGWTPPRRVHLRYDDALPGRREPSPEDRGDRRRDRLLRRHRPHPAALGLRRARAGRAAPRRPARSPTRRSTTP